MECTISPNIAVASLETTVVVPLQFPTSIVAITRNSVHEGCYCIASDQMVSKSRCI